MNIRLSSSFGNRWLQGLLFAFALSLPLSIAAAQIFAYGAASLWILRCAAVRDGLVRRNPFLVFILLFSAAMLVSAAAGWRPAVSLAKCHRIFLFALVFAIPNAAGGHAGGPLRFGARLLFCFLAGCALLGLYDIVRIPLAMLRVPEGWNRADWLFHQGNMRDPQFFMVALLFLLQMRPGAGIPVQVHERGRWWLLGLCLAGLLLHFKRGVWFAFAASAGLAALVGRQWRIVLAFLLLAGGTLMVPQVRSRLADLPNQFRMSGGRMALWTRVAPELIRENPLGIGVGTLRNDDLRRRLPQVEPKLSHLHNNALQVTLETGWAGAAIWTSWMIWILACGIRASHRTKTTSKDYAWLASGASLAFFGLMLNGLVEYNFGDGEILMLISLLMGLIALLIEYTPDPKNGPNLTSIKTNSAATGTNHTLIT